MALVTRMMIRVLACSGHHLRASQEGRDDGDEASFSGKQAKGEQAAQKNLKNLEILNLDSRNEAPLNFWGNNWNQKSV
jgi:hypothetical protein